MAWKFQTDLPVYVQIQNKITADIVTGKYPPDSQLPSVRQIAIDAAVNPNTVQKALCELELKGIVYSKGTVGRFVTNDINIVNEEKEKVKAELIGNFLKNLSSYGITKEEIIKYITEEE